MINDKLRNRHQQISPRHLKKASRVTQDENPYVKIAGTREPTETGYVVRGYFGKNYETYFEVMLAGTASPFYLHPKKDRTFWILNGRGFLTTQQEGKEQVTKKIITGDQITVERGTTYRIATTSTEQLQMFITQSPKYEVSLEIVAASNATKSPEEYQLREPTIEERLGTISPEMASAVGRSKPRYRSKAAQQQARTHRKSRQVEIRDEVTIVPSNGATAIDPDRAGTAAGMNAQPSRGVFDESGAG